MGTPHGSTAGQRLGDWLFFNLTRAFALLTLLLLAGIIGSLVIGSWPALQKLGFAFLWTAEWNPPLERFGALIPIYGTLVTSLIALVIAVPVSFGIALFLTELSPVWLRQPLGIAIELLAAVPSIVYGMWGLMVFAPIFAERVQPALSATLGRLPFANALFAGPPLGIGLLTAGIILAIMIIPFIASVMRDVFAVTPILLKESAYGVGSTTWEVVWHVVLPHARVGVIGGVMLGMGRALGETMAVTFVIGNSNAFSGASLYMPGNSITSTLANEFGEAAPGLYTAALIELGLILFLITLAVLVLSRLLLRPGRREGSRG
ncbi:MAG: phosphate ABC transporter permease subunit PstC [Pseudomonadales bacterium]|jgi:phosphate transport system permease protein|nr:phosphate ABC transporter permease subunit PstC [Pseudomonadales bacterium]MCP5321688.1 phosphate ABC transporter permease subunit PstC [Pseudomonadales bacterium]